jgi:hypothetical protein
MKIDWVFWDGLGRYCFSRLKNRVKYETAVRYFAIRAVFWNELQSDEKRQFYGETAAAVCVGRTWISEGTSTEVHGRRVRKIAASDC